MIRAIVRFLLARPVDPPPARNCDTCRNDLRVEGRRLCLGLDMGHIADPETRREARSLIVRWRLLFLDRRQRVNRWASDCAAWRSR